MRCTGGELSRLSRCAERSAARSPSRRDALSCRRGAPAGSRATLFSMGLRPRRRSCRASSPLGDIDEDEIAFAEAQAPAACGGSAGSASRARRRSNGGCCSTRPRATEWARAAGGSRQREAYDLRSSRRRRTAVPALADDLARLIDDMTTRAGRLGAARRPGAADHLDRYWRAHPRDFCRSRARAWPAMLHEAWQRSSRSGAARSADRGGGGTRLASATTRRWSPPARPARCRRPPN